MTSRKVFIAVESLLAAVVVLMTVFFLYGINDTKKKSVTVFAPFVTQEARSAFCYGVKQAARDYHLEVNYIDTSDVRDAESAKDLLSGAIEGGTDMIIAEPGAGTDTWEIYRSAGSKVPILYVNTMPSVDDRTGKTMALISPDQKAMGRLLGEKIIETYGGNVKGKTIGLVATTLTTKCMSERREGIMEALAGSGCKVVYEFSIFDKEKDAETNIASHPKVDIVAALDNESLESCGDVAAVGNLHHALLFGIGESTKTASFLDKKIIHVVVVPDSFMTGYRSVETAARKLGHSMSRMMSQDIRYEALQRNDLFDSEHQQMLIVMGQNS